MALPHGGNIYHFSKKYSIPEEDFLDFSASVNPLGPSPAALRALKASARSLVNYPDPDCTALTCAVSERLGVPGGSVLVGNGSTELIYLVPRALGAKRALVVAPTYSDYARAARLAGADVSYLRLREADRFALRMDELRAAVRDADLLFLCNPNNPTGTLLEKEAVKDVLKAASRAGAFAVVDEAFIDYVPEHSAASEAASSRGFAVLRNFTKFYGMPGLRAGYVVGGNAFIGRLKKLKEPWSVSTPAQAASLAALSDTAHAERSMKLADRERRYLFGELERIPGLTPYAPSANFILARLTGPGVTSLSLAESLAKKGMLIRDCSNFRGLGNRFVRMAVRGRRDNRELVAALARELKGGL